MAYQTRILDMDCNQQDKSIIPSPKPPKRLNLETINPVYNPPNPNVNPKNPDPNLCVARAVVRH